MMKKQLKRNYQPKNYVDLLYDDVGRLIRIFYIEISFIKSILFIFLESGQCFISIETYGNDVVNIPRLKLLFFSFFVYSINRTVFFLRVACLSQNQTLLFVFIVVTCGSILFVRPENRACVCEYMSK